MSEPELRLQTVKARIAAAEKRAGRSAGSVMLIAVSKTIPTETVLQAAKTYVAKHEVMNLGENYVQEALQKIEKMKVIVKDLQVQWHLIGSLQTNKSKYVVGKFKTIQSVDRLELARALDRRALEAGVIQNILLQVKLGDEPTKGGIDAKDLPALIKQAVTFKNLRVEGLMSLPPIEAEPEASRKFFAQLRESRNQFADLIPKESGTFSQLSMGTTHDFEVAIEEGATMVRVGTAIFGAREIEIPGVH